MMPTTSQDVVARFATAATAFCAWLEAEAGDAEQDARQVECLLAEVYAAGLRLRASPTADSAPTLEIPDLAEDLRQQVRARLARFPIQYYWEALHAFTDPVQGCGDITDDLGDIYHDLKQGLLVYPTHPADAFQHWRYLFFHWGTHAASALRALQAWEPGVELSA